MQFIIKGAKEDLFLAIRAAVFAVISTAREAGTLDEASEAELEMSWGADPKPKKVAGPSDPARARKGYRAIFPAGSTPEQVRALIRQNVQDFGGTTVKARVYTYLANAALGGETFTEAEIRSSLEIAKGTSQREVIGLVRGSFAEAVDL